MAWCSVGEVKMGVGRGGEETRRDRTRQDKTRRKGRKEVNVGQLCIMLWYCLPHSLPHPSLANFAHLLTHLAMLLM